MVEHSLLRSLLTKKFYDDTRGNLCPANLFNKDLRKIKETIDISMDSYERDLTLEELKSLFFVKNFFHSWFVSKNFFKFGFISLPI